MSDTTKWEKLAKLSIVKKSGRDASDRSRTVPFPLWPISRNADKSNRTVLDYVRFQFQQFGDNRAIALSHLTIACMVHMNLMRCDRSTPHFVVSIPNVNRTSLFRSSFLRPRIDGMWLSNRVRERCIRFTSWNSVQHFTGLRLKCQLIWISSSPKGRWRPHIHLVA